MKDWNDASRAQKIDPHSKCGWFEVVTKKTLNVVVSYSHKDEAFRQQLEVALKPLVREGSISLWSDHRIDAGSEIDHEIQLQLKKADVILLLVSPDFLNSDYCYCIEMELAIDRHKNDHSVVIPIILRYSDWQKTPFAGLKSLPTDAKPVFSWEDRDEAWLFVVKGIRGMVENLLPKLVEAEEKPKNQSKTMRDSLINGFGVLLDQYEAHGQLRDVEFGFSALDEDTNGISLGEVCVVSARPNAGLLDFCLCVSKFSSLKHKKTVFFASTRQRAEKISQRILSSLAVVSTHDLQRGLISEDEWVGSIWQLKCYQGLNIIYLMKLILILQGWKPLWKSKSIKSPLIY